jgi:hypothetical protein
MNCLRWGVLSFFLLSGCLPDPPPSTQGDDGSHADDGSLPTDGACPDPFDYVDANLSTPTVSFATNIMPIFQMSCSIAGSTCHGDKAVTTQGRPFLGFFDGGTSADSVWQQLVGVLSVEDPKMNMVTAGNLDQSFLWQKVNNQQCRFEADCRAGTSQYPDCGQSMPYGNQALDPDTLSTIARWIVQGAKNN